MTIKIKQVNVTPDMARLWLAMNYKGQRNLRVGAVNRYAADMRDGRWELTGDPVKFDENDDLVDGQHRLEAVILANVTVPMFVAEGLAASAFAVLDQGVPRTFASLLEGAGLHHASTVAAAVKQVHSYAKYRDFYRKGHQLTLTMPEMLAFYDTTSGITDFAPLGHALAVQFKFSAGLLTAFFYVADVGKGADVALFAEGLKTGANLVVTDPVHYLREQLFDRLATRPDRRRPPAHYSALLTRAWNAHAKGEEIVEFMKARVGGKAPEIYDPRGFIDDRWPRRA